MVEGDEIEEELGPKISKYVKLCWGLAAFVLICAFVLLIHIIKTTHYVIRDDTDIAV